MRSHTDLLRLADWSYSTTTMSSLEFDTTVVGTQTIHTQYDEDAKAAVFAINGTDQRMDWLTNLSMSDTHGWHHGFWLMALSLKESLPGYMHEAKTIQGTGDSMGGAIATILGYMLNRDRGFVSVNEVVTSGCPGYRLLRRNPPEALLLPCVTHYEYGADIVPEALLASGYGHLGTRIRYDKHRRWQVWPLRQYAINVLTDHTSRKLLIAEVGRR